VNNREAATLIWLGIALGCAVSRRDFRSHLWDLAKQLAHPRSLGPLLAYMAWMVGGVVVAHRAGLWRPDLRNDTIGWFLTVGIGLLFALRKAEDDFLRRTLRSAAALTVFIEVVMNLGVYSFPVEFFLLPFVTCFVLIAAFSEGKPEHKSAHGCLGFLLGVVGLVGFVYVAVRVTTDFDAGHTVRALALPIWLTIASLPFVYAFGLLAEYQSAFLRIDSHTDDAAHRSRAKWALLRAAHVRASELRGFAGHWIWDLTAAKSSADARAVMQRWRSTWRAERHAARVSDARAFMRAWVTETNPTLAEIHADALRRSWERLTGQQRVALKAEGVQLAPNAALAAAVRGLAD
jgi:hypothetical protein